MTKVDVELPKTLFEVAYQELRRIARGQRRAAGTPLTLDTTALVHEVYVKLHAVQAARTLDRAHLLSLATRAMRQILVDHARAQRRLKRGGGLVITKLGEEQGVDTEATPLDLVALDDALGKLAQFDPRAGQVMELRVFGGLEIAEIAQLQHLTERTVFRDWRRARAWLVRELEIDSA